MSYTLSEIGVDKKISMNAPRRNKQIKHLAELKIWYNCGNKQSKKEKVLQINNIYFVLNISFKR